jgi:hypothetical protein
MDVDDDDSVRSGVAGMLAAGGRIDALVACAGWGLAGAVEQCTIEEAKAQLETNFWGCVRVLQQVLPAMRAQGGGRIVLMISIGGVIGIPFGAAVAKAVGLMERDEGSGVPAAEVAVVVRRVLESRRPPRRVSAGRAGERVGLLAKRLLPFRAFQAAAPGKARAGDGEASRPDPSESYTRHLGGKIRELRFHLLRQQAPPAPDVRCAGHYVSLFLDLGGRILGCRLRGITPSSRRLLPA